MIEDANLSVYEDRNIVKSYVGKHYLTMAETAIKRTFRHVFTRDVLDIGIGAGRTTFYFAKMANRYSGMDFSERMINFCKKEYAKLADATFLQGDARTLSQYEDASYDTALFSFNGIDCVDYQGRNQILQQVYRVLKPGGIFIFSYHNTGYLNRLYSYHWSKNPMYWIWNWKRKQKIKSINGPKSKYSGKRYFRIKDGGEDFMLDILYIDPSHQEKDLLKAGFRILQRLENATGRILTAGEAKQSRAASIYLVCEKVV